MRHKTTGGRKAREAKDHIGYKSRKAGDHVQHKAREAWKHEGHEALDHVERGSSRALNLAESNLRSFFHLLILCNLGLDSVGTIKQIY